MTPLNEQPTDYRLLITVALGRMMFGAIATFVSLWIMGRL